MGMKILFNVYEKMEVNRLNIFNASKYFTYA